jgi:hypothetical protein
MNPLHLARLPVKSRPFLCCSFTFLFEIRVNRECLSHRIQQVCLQRHRLAIDEALDVGEPSRITIPSGPMNGH